jgi:hypothetical protein
MDTLSRISNYLPSVRTDPSGRIFQSGQLLFPPWLVLDTIGSIRLPIELEAYIEEISPFDSDLFDWIDFAPFKMISDSRPLFPGHVSTLTKFSRLNIWDSVMALADTKISGGMSSSQFILQTCNRKEIDIRNLALVSMRITVTLLNFECQEKIISHFMGTLFGISNDRESLLVQYVDEPILGEAACRALNLDGAWDSALDTIFRKFAAGHLAFGQTRGDVGELVCSLIMTLAYDAAAIDSFSSLEMKTINSIDKTLITESSDCLKEKLIFSRPITVHQFLKTLLPESAVARIDINNEDIGANMKWLLNGFVSFT